MKSSVPYYFSLVFSVHPEFEGWIGGARADDVSHGSARLHEWG
jgi:hypothetical protein